MQMPRLPLFLGAGAVIAIAIGAFWWFTRPATQETGLPAPRAEVLDISLFADQQFTRLRASVNVTVPAERGRPNPFTRPIGRSLLVAPETPEPVPEIETTPAL